MLETRTLLAGDASPISSSGQIITNLDAARGSTEVAIAGLEGGQLTIDATLLPDTVTDLRISGFDTVTITGSDKLSSLSLSKIGSFSATDLDVTSELKVRDVGTLKIHALVGVAWLNGSEMRLEVATASSATIMSNLDRLTISSSSNIVVISGNPHQEIRLDFHSSSNQLHAFSKVIYTDDLPPGTVTDVDNGQFTVIILSLASLVDGDARVLKLKDALKKGDADAIRNAFAEFLPRGELKDSVYAMTFSAQQGANLSLEEIARLINQRERPVDAPTPSTVNVSAHLLSPESGQSAAFEAAPLPHATAGSIRLSGAAESALPFGEKITMPSPQDAHEGDAHASSYSKNEIIENVRSTLSALVSGTAQLNSVSAYIIDGVGTQLEPGELPGLLVDAKSARSRRAAVDWVEI